MADVSTLIALHEDRPTTPILIVANAPASSKCPAFDVSTNDTTRAISVGIVYEANDGMVSPP